MARVSKTAATAAAATLALFSIFCLNAEAVSSVRTVATTEQSSKPAFEADPSQDASSLKGVTDVVDDLSSQIPMDGPGNMMSGVLGPQEPQLPTPKLVGVKSLVSGLVILFMLLASMAIELKAAESSDEGDVVRSAPSRFDIWADRWSIHGEDFDLGGFLVFGSMIMAASGMADIVNSLLGRRRQRVLAHVPPPLRGVGFASLGFILLGLVLTGSMQSALLYLALPSIVVGSLLIVYSLLERHKYFKEQRNSEKDVTLNVEKQ